MTRPRLGTGIGPCAEQNPALFDSRRPLEHARARAVCATCPYVQACLRLACDIARDGPNDRAGAPDGTWGGLLWRDGRIV